ncbi:MAG: hypothetical protein ACREM2_00745 [Vulcanimicrobiaceae bacterium]
MKRVLAVAILLASSACPRAALADPYGDLQRAASAFRAQKAIHADMRFSNGQTVKVDLVGSDRTRVVLPNGFVELVIGDNVWFNQGGTWRQMPSAMAGTMGSTLARYRRSPVRDVVPASVKDMGMQSVGGASLHAYSFTGRDGSRATVWLGADDLPQRAVTSDPRGTATIVYSYGGVTIDPP